MSIATGQIITWSELTDSVLNAIQAACCNVGAIASGVPSRMKDTSGVVAVKTFTTNQEGSLGAGHPNVWSQQQLKFYAHPSNKISLVATGTITNSSKTGEWDTFLSSAHIDSRSNKIIQAKDLGKAVGLFQQFMSYHLKPVYGRLEVYGTLESIATFSGTKYMTNTELGGACNPKYDLPPVEPSTDPDVTDSDIQNLTYDNFINQNLNWGVMSSSENPKPFRSELKGTNS